MYREIKIFEVSLGYNQGLTLESRRKLRKKYGSKRSGTFYVIADDPIEAAHVLQAFIREQEGIELALSKIRAEQTHLVPKAILGPRP